MIGGRDSWRKILLLLDRSFVWSLIQFEQGTVVAFQITVLFVLA
jgi:hypothetical protein